MSAIPVPVVVNVAATHRINLLPVDKGLMKSIVKVNPTYFEMSIPGKTYQGVPKPVPMLAYEAFWVAHEEVKPRVVYEMLKVTYKPKTRKFLHTFTRAGISSLRGGPYAKTHRLALAPGR